MRSFVPVVGLVLTVLVGVACSDRDISFDGDERIPDHATVVAHGEGTMSFTATERGVAYVLDRRTKERIYSADLGRDDEIVVRPDRNRIEINGRVVDRGGLDEDASHEIQWSPSGGAQHAGGGSASLPEALADARRVASGRGTMSHRFDQAGHVWVWDATAGDIVCGHRVKADSVLKVQPDRDHVLLNGRRLETRASMNERHTYHLYFERE
jgi:hypothetical protein